MRILIIRPGAIGDALLAFHILKFLRMQYIHPHITFVSNASVLPLAQASGLVDEASDYADSAWSEMFATSGIQTPRTLDILQCIDLAICWLRDPDGQVKQNLLKAGVRQVVVAPGRSPEGQGMHVVDYLASTIGLQHITMDKFIPFTLPDSEKCIASPLSAPVAIHPGSGSTSKCWPACNFKSVIEQLIQHTIPVLLLSGPADAERVREILSYLSHQHRAGNLTVLENAPLLEVAHRLQQCKGYLGNDSGITHLAAMLGVPTLALFGPSDPLTWRPLGPSVIVVREDPLERLNVSVAIDTMNSFYLNGAVESDRTSGMGTVHNVEQSSILDTRQTEN